MSDEVIMPMTWMHLDAKVEESYMIVNASHYEQPGVFAALVTVVYCIRTVFHEDKSVMC